MLKIAYIIAGILVLAGCADIPVNNPYQGQGALNSNSSIAQRSSDQSLIEIVRQLDDIQSQVSRIQGQAESFIKSINGSYSNIVGLPLYETKNILNSIGVK